MVKIGYTLMTEQAGPRALVDHAVQAEATGFDFAVSSDHFFPWLDEMGHSPNAWVTLGAIAQATTALPLMTYVTAPTFRYHPAVVAQQAATLQILANGRFTLGLGSGENLNEHIVGGGWPPADQRQKRLVEAVEIIRALFDGGYVNYDGRFFQVNSAKLWDLPDTPVPIGVAVSGEQSCELFAPLADVMVAISPEAHLVSKWRKASSSSSDRVVGQVPVSWGSDRDAAIERAHRLFRWSTGDWKVNAELPSTAGFDAASSMVRPTDVAEQIPCGNDIDAIVEVVAPFVDAGFTDIALVQIGGDAQDDFFEDASSILAELRKLG
jgi:G6PDH family F420-dependent oxidoreductase